MSESKALGFWAKHCWAMERFCSEDELPSELRDIREDEKLSGLIDEVISIAERDAQQLLTWLHKDIEATICRKGSPFKVVLKRSSDQWELNLHLRPRRGREDQFKAETGAHIYESTDGVVKVAVWVWAKGGKSTERMFTTILSGAVEGATERGNTWASGVALLFDEPLASPQFLCADGFSVDLSAVRNKVNEALERQDNDRLSDLFRALRR
ncbi:hypothetical protein [Pseudoxanthomonas mexicana]